MVEPLSSTLSGDRWGYGTCRPSNPPLNRRGADHRTFGLRRRATVVALIDVESRGAEVDT